VKGKHIGVFEVLEVPLVPVVEADEPVHGGEVEHPSLFAPLEEEGDGPSVFNGKSNNGSIVLGQYARLRRPEKDSKLVVLLGVRDQPISEERPCLGRVDPQVRVLDSEAKNLLVFLQGPEGGGLGFERGARGGIALVGLSGTDGYVDASTGSA
jgi:hypothetical protein